MYDVATLDRQYAELRATYPNEFAISYSVKANPCPAILRHFVGLGLGLEIASAGEFHQALKAGCPPERVLFAGPGKTETELEFVLARGIGEIHVESLIEAGRVSAAGAKLGVRPRVALRVNPGAEVQGGAMRMGGKPAPFGVDEERLETVLDRLVADSACPVSGNPSLHGNADPGRCRPRGSIPARHRDRAARGRPNRPPARHRGLRRWPRHPLLPERGAAPHGPPRRVAEIPGRRRPLRSTLQGTQFLIEPGRYLVGEAGIYIARVNDIKESRGKTFLIVDGGMNHHLAASGNLGQVIKRNFPLAILNRLDDAGGRGRSTWSARSARRST